MNRWLFYKEKILKHLPLNSKVLVIGASINEIKIFNELNYRNVTFGIYSKAELKNIIDKNYYKNFNFIQSDCRKIKYKRASFDYCFTHATLHHIDLPHLAFSELYRVSKKGVLVIEGNDSLIMRLSSALGFCEEFEVSSISRDTGGLLNTSIPNYVYRWTEREVTKLFNSFDPKKKCKIFFEYSYDFFNKNVINKKFNITLLNFLRFFLYIYFFLFRKQGNLMSIYIDKLNCSNRFI
jgi:SAM-dependent methyltransferase